MDIESNKSKRDEVRNQLIDSFIIVSGFIFASTFSDSDLTTNGLFTYSILIVLIFSIMVKSLHIIKSSAPSFVKPFASFAISILYLVISIFFPLIFMSFFYFKGAIPQTILTQLWVVFLITLTVLPLFFSLTLDDLDYLRSKLSITILIILDFGFVVYVAITQPFFVKMMYLLYAIGFIVPFTIYFLDKLYPLYPFDTKNQTTYMNITYILFSVFTFLILGAFIFMFIITMFIKYIE